jgi:hypothetical protein
MGAMFFYIGERNLIENFPNPEYHRFVSLFGQMMIVVANATLVMASLCFVLEKQDDRWKRIFGVARKMFLHITVGLMVGAILYIILTLSERDLLTITVCGFILVIGATIIKARPRIENNRNKQKSIWKFWQHWCQKHRRIKEMLRIGLRLIIFFAVFLIVLRIFGVPFGWVSSHVIPISMVSTERNMDVEIDWDAPLIPGQNVEILVVDSENLFSIQDAKVTISKDGSKITDLFTDENGLARFEYPGETTIVEVDKEGYRSVMKVIPHTPSEWFVGIVSSIIGGSIVAFIDRLIPKRKGKFRKR